MAWIWALLGIYIAGFVLSMAFHLVCLQMVTPELALLRSAVWPIFWTTGWPEGTSLRMD